MNSSPFRITAVLAGAALALSACGVTGSDSGTPAAEVTTAAMVEMLTVCAPSPPVPTMSTVAICNVTGVATSSMAAARPVTSWGDSPFARRATTNAAICAGVASRRPRRPGPCAR